MKNTFLKFTLSFLLVSMFFGSETKAQNLAACNAAIDMCTTDQWQFSSAQQANAFANVCTVSNPCSNPQNVNSGCFLSGGPKPTFIVITVASNGQLGWNVGANNSGFPQVGYYDWMMWPITGGLANTCNQIMNNQLAPTACNWNGPPNGGTGMGTIPAGGSTWNYQPSINVTAGQQFIICISNYSSVNATLKFQSTGTAMLGCSNVAAHSATVCAKNSANATNTFTNAVITATLPNVPLPTFTLNPGNVVQTSPVFSLSPNITTVYTLSAAGTNTNSSTVVTSTTSFTVTIFNPTVSATTNSASICQGGNISLTANGTGALSYTWTGPSGYNNPTQNPNLPNIMPWYSGVFTVTSTYTTGTTPHTATCRANNTTTVQVLPTAPITASNIKVCEPEKIVLYANAAGASTYSWSGPNGYTANVQGPVINTTTPSLTGIYTVTATYAYSTSTLTCLQTKTVDVVVNPILKFKLNQPKNFCHNETMIINGPAGATSYVWNGPSGFLSTQQDLVLNSVQKSQSGVYQVVAFLGDCPTKDSVFVVIYDPMQLTSMPADVTICHGDSLPVFAQAIGGSGILSYSWTPQVGIKVPVGQTNTLSPHTTMQYEIIVVDAACPDLTISGSFKVNVNPRPIPNIGANKIEGCVPLTVDFTTMSNPQSVGTLWSFGPNMTSFGDSVKFTFDKPGTYQPKVSIVDVNGCKSITDAPFQIKAYPHPEPDFTWDPGNPNSNDNIVTFYPTYRNGPMKSWYWNFGDPSVTSDSSTMKNPTYVYEKVDNYPVFLVATNVYGCSDTLIKVVTINEDFTLFVPNAFTPNGDGLNDIFIPKGLGFKPESFEMSIYDRWGNLMYRTGDPVKGWDGTVKGVLAPSDVYVYKIKVVSATKGVKKEAVGHVTLYK